jgi:hypothetical protein
VNPAGQRHSSNEPPHNRGADTDCFFDCEPKTYANSSGSVLAQLTPVYYTGDPNGEYPMCKYNKPECRVGYCAQWVSGDWVCDKLDAGEICTEDDDCTPSDPDYPDCESTISACTPNPPMEPNATRDGCVCNPARLKPGQECTQGGGCDDPCPAKTKKEGCICVCDPDQLTDNEVCPIDGKCPQDTVLNDDGITCRNTKMPCTIPHALVASRDYDEATGTYGLCIVRQCEDGYHISGNSCVSNERDCVLGNGRGVQTWDERHDRWGDCIAESCLPGYTNDPALTNELARPCGQCNNKFGVLGEVAVSSYVRECEIASCMYQGEKYNLENNECVPICDDGYADETGVMRWNNSTKKCDRICNTGYSSW